MEKDIKDKPDVKVRLSMEVAEDETGLSRFKRRKSACDTAAVVALAAAVSAFSIGFYLISFIALGVAAVAFAVRCWFVLKHDEGITCFPWWWGGL